MSIAIAVALGANWRRSSSRLVPRSEARKVTPVTFPPGLLRLATRPSSTGSPPVVNTIGIVFVAVLAASSDPPVAAITEIRRPTNFGRERGQAIVTPLGPAVFDRDVLTLDIANVV